MLREKFHDIYYAIIHFSGSCQRVYPSIAIIAIFQNNLRKKRKYIIKYSIIDNYNFQLI